MEKQGEEEVKAALEKDRKELENLLDKEEGQWRDNKLMSREYMDKKRKLQGHPCQGNLTQEVEEEQG